ncbi:acetyl-CoA hydrolase/transferase family protein [Sinosporangium siamense]|uniref:Acetyl-CoA hydrolase n=1 Tax=Sinosporangium siamense TaxID=1367973 RepID=A0A919VB46_9ACTN|nr:acetyl-CoA hydrolase/transferase family protein [Sinosporangium siamense]GII97068.1 acetyl-CoA hydrolase [Sinosporangium siamense]
MTTHRTAPRAVALADLDFTRIVRPGDTVLWTQGVGEPLPLMERLLAQRHDIGRFSVLYGGAGFAEVVRPEHADVISFQTLGAVGSNRALTAAGVADILPCHLSDLPRLIAGGVLRVDVVIAQLSENDRGELSYGPAGGYVATTIPTARTVVAEINDQAPWTHSRHPVDARRIDIAVRTSRPLVEVKSRPASAIDEAIAANVVDLVPDGATVQLGIGSVPNAVTGLLTGRRDLGLHSGVIGDAVVDLIRSGAVTNAAKPVDRGVSVTGGLIGTGRLFDFAHGNDQVRVEPVTYTHDLDILRRLPRLTAINSALEVDLTGQVAAEVAGSAYVGTIGGQVDFARGAFASAGGRSIIALPSRTASSGRPRIVPRIASGVVTTARADADVIITEYGKAELRGRPIAERVRRMIAIAHPEDRESLDRQARDHVAGYR